MWKLRQVMAELNRDYQIIVVDDASTDSTPAVLSPYIRVLPLTVIRNSQRRGYADALELAIREAVRRSPYPKRDAVITLQADFTEDPDAVPTLVKRIEAGADLVTTEAVIEEETPRPFRWGRRLFRWMLRGKEWAQGDGLSGLRAYRVVTLKRALEARGTGRLLSWNGWGANVELLSLTAPHSRRTEIVETTLKSHRHQRDTRFAFMEPLRLVRGALSGKPNASATALATDGVIAAPLPIAVEQPAAQQHTRTHQRVRDRQGPAKRTRGESKTVRPDRTERPERPERGGRGGRGAGRQAQSTAQAASPRPSGRGQRPEKARPAPADPTAVTEAPAAVAPTAGEATPTRKRRRPRRRKGAKTQQSPQLVVEGQTETPSEAPSPESASEVLTGSTPDGTTPKKKSRRGRRGGRGRRRGPRIEGGETTNGEPAGEAMESRPSEPPPLAAEGD